MRISTIVVPLVLVAATACSSAGGQSAGESGPDSRGESASATYERAWTSSLDAERVLWPIACGGVVAAGTLDHARPVVLEDVDSGHTRRPKGLALIPSDGEADLPPVAQLTCVDTSAGPRIVVDQILIDAERKRTVRRLSGLDLRGHVRWTRRMNGSEDVATIGAGTVTLTIDDVYDHASVIDASDGSPIVKNMDLDGLVPLSVDRLAYYESETLDPVIVDAKLRPVRRISLPERVEPRISGWVAGGGVAVLTVADGAATGYDGRTGGKLWTVRTNGLDTGAAVIDGEAGVFVTTTPIQGAEVPEPTGNGQNTYTGIDIESGEVLWRRRGDSSPLHMVASGGAFANGSVDAGYDSATLFDSRSGTPIEFDDDVEPMALSPDGILVADGDELTLLSR